MFTMLSVFWNSLFRMDSDGNVKGIGKINYQDPTHSYLLGVIGWTWIFETFGLFFMMLFKRRKK